jgi:hypothetical protein
MYRSNRELWFSFIVIVILTVLYLFMVVTLKEIPAASDFFGHMLGVLGFILMLMTETLYSLRKRSRSARWGRMADWLQFHIFTGLVGPYMVLLHTSWKFNGLAGLVMLMTLIIVASGFIGRYIYTAIPRTADGIKIEAVELQRQIAVMETELKRLEATQSAQITRAQRKHLKTLQRQRRALVRQVASLAQARRLMALWHAIHIPIGVALFTAAFVHMGAALYYATLLR